MKIAFSKAETAVSAFENRQLFCYCGRVEFPLALLQMLVVG